ncbi:hypothetical protein BSK64_11595 [Paenibacillus odorifer]|nr:hypothetical protein BSK64_11595 [Paenibacillus odorifer]
MAEGAALLRLPWRVRLRGLYGKSGARPAAQGRPLAPRAIAALRDCGSGARARAVSDQLRKVAYGAPSDCCPAGSQLGCPGKSGERPAAQGRPLAPRAIAALTGSRLGSQGKSGATSCARSRNGAPSDCCPAGTRLGSQGKSGERPAAQGREMAPRAIAALTGSRLGSQGKSGANSCARSRMAPRAIAALRERGSGARARAVSDQLRKVAQRSKRAL